MNGQERLSPFEAEPGRIGRRVFILMAHDPGAGAAVRPVGGLGLTGEESHVSWVPYEPGAEMWQARLAEATVPLRKGAPTLGHGSASF